MPAIAEAFVRLRPDLTQFRAELQAGVTAAVASVKAPPVNILARVTTEAQQAALATQGVGAASAASAAAGAAAQEQASTRVTAALRATAAETAAARAATSLLVSEQTAAANAAAVEAGAMTELAAAQRNATAFQAAAAQATRALSVAQTQSATAAEAQAAGTLAAAEAARTDAVAQTAAARATASHATAQKGLARGAAGGALSMLGLRGATIAATAPFLAGSAAILAFGKSVALFGTFEQTLNSFQAVTGATADEMERVSDAAKQLGADVTLPGVSAGDAATAMSQLARAGLSVEDSIDGARGVLELATAAEIDNAQATELVASSLNAFGLAGEDASHVADVFANAANAAQGSIADFGVALQQVEAVSAQVGVSFEDTNALLTLLARNGLRGSDAGTSLRTAFLRLAAPTKEARDLIQRLGLQVRDFQGNLRPEVFSDFGQATLNMSANVRDAAAATVFGQDAIRAALLAAGEGEEGLDEVRAAMEKQGTAAEVAGAKTQGLTGSLKNLQNQAETTGTSLGSKLAPAVGFVADQVASFFEGLRRLDEIDIFPDFNAAANARVGGSGDIVSEEFKKMSAAAIEGSTALNVLIGAANEANAAEVEGISGLGKDLREALADLQTAGGANAVGNFADAARTQVDQVLEQLRRLGAQGVQIMRANAKELAPVLGNALRDAAGDITKLDLAAPESVESLRTQIQQLANLGPEGEAQLRELGKDLSAAMADGIESGSSDAVTAARNAVRAAIIAGRTAVTESIRSARSNLESLAGSLEQQIEQVFDAAPPTAAAKALDALRESLARLQEQTERRQLRFSLGQAQQDLRDARESIVQLGAATTPEQEQARAEFLEPFIEKVKDARSAQKEFNLEDTIKDQDKLNEAAKKAATEGMERLLDQFQAGKISAGQFGARIQTLLRPQIDALRNNPNLGLRFTRDFQRNLATLLRQARELAGFVGTANTTPGPQAISPTAAGRTAAANVAAAQANLQKQLTANQTTAKKSTEAVALLRLINRSLNPPKKTAAKTTAGTREEPVPTNK